MSIWGSFCTFGRIRSDYPGMGLDDPPYTDYTDGTGHYTTASPESLASTPRGGWLGFASSPGMTELIRVNAEDGDGAEVEVLIDRRQAALLRDALSRELSAPAG